MFLFSVLLLIGAGGASVALRTSDVDSFDLNEAQRHFEEFIQKYERNYETEDEKNMRFEIFKDNLRKINKLNSKRTQEHQAVFGITKMADRTKEDLRQKLGFKYNLSRSKTGSCEHKMVKRGTKDYPKELNWANKNKVTAVKNQGMCGSCWAFSGIGNIESQYAIKYGELLDLSEQQILDCDVNYEKCEGGEFDGAAITAIQLGGIELDSNYPYDAYNNTCRFNKTNVKVKVSKCIRYQIIDEVNDLKTLLNEVGPLSIALSAYVMQFYTDGILEGGQFMTPDHAVLLVGYGVEKDIPYWIIKNSWGKSYGINGYFRIKAGENAFNVLSAGAVTAILE